MGKGNWGWEGQDYEGMVKKFCVLIVAMVTHIYTCVKIHRTIHRHTYTHANQFHCVIFQKNLILQTLKAH